MPIKIAGSKYLDHTLIKIVDVADNGNLVIENDDSQWAIQKELFTEETPDQAAARIAAEVNGRLDFELQAR